MLQWAFVWKIEDILKLFFDIFQSIIEKFRRNENKIAVQDIAIRNYKMNENKICLQFHYAEDTISATTKEFLKPPKSEMGEEVTFDAAVTGYVVRIKMFEIETFIKKI